MIQTHMTYSVRPDRETGSEPLMLNVLRIVGIIIAIAACLALALVGTAQDFPASTPANSGAASSGVMSFWGRFVVFSLAIIGGLLLAVFAGKKR